MQNDERFYVYFFCDPFKPFNRSVSDGSYLYTMAYTPYYCGKGTQSRVQNLKRSKRINDKTRSIQKKGKEPIVVWLGPFDEKTALLQEEFFVKIFKRREFNEGVLLNLKDGGGKGGNYSPETIEKMRNSHLGKVPWNKGKKGVTRAWNKGLSKETDSRVARYTENMTASKKNNKWFTNGNVSVQRKECPEGFYPGRSKFSRKKPRTGKKVIVDGIEFMSIICAARYFNTTKFKIKKRVQECY